MSSLPSGSQYHIQMSGLNRFDADKLKVSQLQSIPESLHRLRIRARLPTNSGHQLGGAALQFAQRKHSHLFRAGVEHVSCRLGNRKMDKVPPSGTFAFKSPAALCCRWCELSPNGRMDGKEWMERNAFRGCAVKTYGNI